MRRGHAQRLRLRDVRDACRLVGECRELGGDAIAWQQRLFEGLCHLTGAQVGIGGLLDGAGRPFEGVPWIDTGWADAEQRSHWLRYNADGAMYSDMTYVRYRQIPDRFVTCTRERLAEDVEWYRSVEYNEYRKPSRVDAWLISSYHLDNAGSISLITLSRARGDRQFTPRDRRLVRICHAELIPLLGTHLSLGAGLGSSSALPPRLRQTLDRLLVGDSEKEAARHLGLSPHTVHEYVMALYRRFNVTSRAELLALCLGANHKLPPPPIDGTPIYK